VLESGGELDDVRAGGTVSELFDDLPEQRRERSQASARPRVLEADRRQVGLEPVCLDDLLAPEHPARAVWAFVEGLDLAPLYALIRASEDRAGRPAIDPKILVSLWLYATVDGVGSARALARLCGEHVAYRWLCGGVSVNHHTLSDFRVAHVDWLDGVLTASVAGLMHQGLVTLERVAQDGMRVRASAGAASFRRRKSLERCRDEAKAQVDALKAELEADPAGADRRRRAARERAAAERLDRVEAALRTLDAVEAADAERGGSGASRAGDGRSDAAGDDDDDERDKRRARRASTTDPEVRVMKMADGGWRPAVNVQYAADVASGLVVGVDVANGGNDQPQLVPMVEQIAERYGTAPGAWLADGGYVSLAAVKALDARGIALYAPPPKSRGGRAAGPRRGDGPLVAGWRERMASDEGRAIYQQRAATSEWVNAGARGRGLQQIPVRGRAKARAIALWHAIGHNLTRLIAPPAARPA
jgi:transposase